MALLGKTYINSIKKRLLDFYSLLQEIGLFIIATIVFSALAISGITYTLFKHVFIKRDYSSSKQLKPIFRSLTLGWDGFANASSGELLNDINKPYIKYGKWYYTISATTGLNKLMGRDTLFRKIIDLFLGKNHCVNSITQEQRKFYDLKD